MRALLAFVAVGILSCSGPAAPVRVVPHLPAAVPADVPHDRPRLGVGLFTDARPRSDRRERSPSLRIRWYGVERRGEYQTGDGSFVGSIAEGIRHDALGTLARSGAFSSVQLLEVSEAGASAAVAAGTVDLVLTATIQELVGIRRHDFLVSYFLLGGIWNRTEEPVGLAHIYYRVYDAAGPVLEERIDTMHRSAVRAPAQAALDAAARANERVAEQVFRAVVPEAARVARDLPVRIVDGCALGRERVLLLAEDASAVLEREAGVRLRPTWARDSAPGPADLASALDTARRRPPPEGGASVWLVRPFRADPSSPYGLSVPLGQHTVVGCDEAGDIRVGTLVHEIAHLFGAIHVEDRGSVMNRVAEFDGRFLDPLNRRILRTTYDRPFGSPLPEETRRQLDVLYRAALRVVPGVDEGEVRSLLAAVDRPAGRTGDR